LPSNGADVDPVDRQIVDVAVDLHPLEPGATDHRVAKVDVVEPRSAEVDLLEAAVAQVRAQIVRHGRHCLTGHRRSALETAVLEA
jgi:hypothetical protein